MRGIKDISFALAVRLETTFGYANKACEHVLRLMAGVAFCCRLSLIETLKAELCKIAHLVRLLKLLESHSIVKKG